MYESLHCCAAPTIAMLRDGNDDDDYDDDRKT